MTSSQTRLCGPGSVGSSGCASQRPAQPPTAPAGLCADSQRGSCKVLARKPRFREKWQKEALGAPQLSAPTFTSPTGLHGVLTLSRAHGPGPTVCLFNLSVSHEGKEGTAAYVNGVDMRSGATCFLHRRLTKSPVSCITCIPASRGTRCPQLLSLSGDQRCKSACFGASRLTGLGLSVIKKASLK